MFFSDCLSIFCKQHFSTKVLRFLGTSEFSNLKNKAQYVVSFALHPFTCVRFQKAQESTSRHSIWLDICHNEPIGHHRYSTCCYIIVPNPNLSRRHQRFFCLAPDVVQLRVRSTHLPKVQSGAYEYLECFLTLYEIVSIASHSAICLGLSSKLAQESVNFLVGFSTETFSVYQ